MRHLVDNLRAASLPFVTRALRGPRRRRLWLASGLAALLVILMGTWITLSPDPLARDMRVATGLEASPWERQHREFTVFVDSEPDRLRTLADLDPSPPRDAWLTVDSAARSAPVSSPTLQALQVRATALRDAHPGLAPEHVESWEHEQEFQWRDPSEVDRLRAIVDADLKPRVVVYRSPRSVRDAVRVVGVMAGGLLMLLAMVFGPLLAAVQLAQELHENTLPPLTGTALTARQLVVGLALGSLAPVAIVATPLLVVELGAATFAGRLLPTAGSLAMTVAMGAMLLGLAMLAAKAVGRIRAPGLVGIGLLSLLGMAALGGLIAGVQLDGHTAGVVTVLPGAGPSHLLAEALFPTSRLGSSAALHLDFRLVIATLGAIVLAGATLLAMERKVAGTDADGALSRSQAAVAGITLAALASAAVAGNQGFGEQLLLSLALVLLPLQVLLMSRAPGGDTPGALRPIPVGPLFAEHLSWLCAVAILAVVLTGGPTTIYGGLPVGLVHLTWALAVIPMVTLRATAGPMSVLTKVWLMVCLGAAMMELVTGGVVSLTPLSTRLLPLASVSPTLGLIQLAMLVWIPISLWRGLAPHRSRPTDLRPTATHAGPREVSEP